MNHSFEISAAQKLGVEEAILAESIRHWLLHNEANEQNLRGGRHWTYNSAKAWTETYPYWSSKQIYRIIRSLEEQGIILVEKPGGVDRRMWITFSDFGKSIFPYREIQEPEREDAFSQTVKSPNIGTVTIPSTIPIEIKNDSSLQIEEEIYKIYPRKVARPAALESIRKAIKKHGHEHILKRTKDYAEFCIGKEMKFVPYPATFYNQEQYNDEWIGGVERAKTNQITLAPKRSTQAEIDAELEERRQISLMIGTRAEE